MEGAQSKLDFAVLPAIGQETVMLGVLDIGSNVVESVESLVERGREALQYLPKEQLILAPDCGMLQLSRTAARKKLVNLAQSLRKQACQRVSTSQLNQVIRRAVRSNPPPHRRNKRPRIYFATQVATEPPTIVLKCNEPRLLDESWKRFLLNVLHEELAFPEVPIKLYLRPRSQRDSDTITEDKPI